MERSLQRRHCRRETAHPIRIGLLRAFMSQVQAEELIESDAAQWDEYRRYK